MSRYSACTSQIGGSRSNAARVRESATGVFVIVTGRFGWPGSAPGTTVFFSFSGWPVARQPAIAHDVVDDQRGFAIHRHDGVVERGVVRVLTFIHAALIAGRVITRIPPAAREIEAAAEG